GGFQTRPYGFIKGTLHSIEIVSFPASS
ncbi:MAG: hypothetical protein HW404_191, partial [Anaerolineales bacterium]|nr:hypothetical protein [Anaerolineales bacterium]